MYFTFTHETKGEAAEATTGGVLSTRCLQKLRKFYRKTTLLESLFDKVAGPQASSFIKNRLQHRCFPAQFAKSLRTPILKNT